MHNQRPIRCIPQLAAVLMTLPAPLLQSAPSPSPAPAPAPASSKTEPALRSFHAQPCFVLSNKEVEVAVTQLGAQTRDIQGKFKPGVYKRIRE